MTCIQLAMLCSYDMYRPLFMPSSQPAIGYISTSSGLVNKFGTCWDVIAAVLALATILGCYVPGLAVRHIKTLEFDP